MADSSSTPPPKDVVTTRTPTPTTEVEDNQPLETPAPEPEKQTPGIEKPPAADAEPASVEVEDAAKNPDDSAPTQPEPSKEVTEPGEDAAPVTESEANQLTEPADVPQAEPSAVDGQAPAAEVTQEQEKVSDVTQEQSPASAELAPASAEQAPASGEQAPASEEQLPASEDQVPAAPPASEEVPAASSKTPGPETADEKALTPTDNVDNSAPVTDETTAGIAIAEDPPTEEQHETPKPGTPVAGSPPPPASNSGTPVPATPQTQAAPGSKPGSPQQADASKTATPTQADGSKAATPAMASPEKTEIKATPPPPPTAQNTVAPSTAPSTHPPPPPTTALTETAKAATPASPSAPSPEKTALSTLSEGDEANIITGNALSIVWSFGLNKNIPMVNLSTDNRSVIMYACAHTGICYNYENNTQKLLQGHNNNIAATCLSEDKRWLATADKGPNNCMVIIWDTNTFFPVQTIFDAGDQGVVAMALTPDARYLATVSAGTPQVLCIWDWTTEGDHALCSATLDPSYGVQNFILFNPDDTTQIVSSSETQVIFYAWDGGEIEYFCPPLTDDDFNKPVGKYTQSIFLENTNKCLTATSIGNLVVWASNKPLTKAIDNEPTPNKKALKLVKVQDRGINVLMVVDSLIIMGDMNGHVKMFDQTLNLLHWYQDLNIGPINAISFTHVEKWGLERVDTQDYPADCSLAGRTLTMRNFVIGSTNSIYAEITPKGTDIKVILRNHDSPIHSIVAHPKEKKMYVGSYSGLLQIWDYETRVVVASRKFERGHMIHSMDIDPKGYFIAVGFTNGVVKVLDALNLQDEDTEPFRYARDAITHIKFSHDSEYLATADGEFVTSLFKRQHGTDVQPWIYVGRHKAHYKEIKDVCFGVELDSNKPRLLTLGQDRTLVEYDLENSSKDNLMLIGIERIEQSAIPQCITWYPPLNKEHFILTANDQFKFKLYNVTTKRCRQTLLGPTYGSPLQKISILPTADDVHDKRYLAYINKDKVGLHILPLDGNPHNSMALVAHPDGVSNMVPSHDGKYLFTAGGGDTTIHMWHINLNALEAQSKLGGDDLIPFYGLMEGGREGELFAELEDYFYYAQLRHQGINTMMKRQVDVKIALSEVPYVMRAMGFYPSEQEVEDMLNEVKFSKYVETGEDVTEIDLGNFIRLYINHRPAFGLSHQKIGWCFDVLSNNQGGEAAIKRGQFLDLLQRKGEHMTEYELSEYLTTLLGFNEEGGSCEQHLFDPSQAGNIIIDNLPTDISTRTFTDDLLSFGFYQEPDVLKIEHL